MAQQNTLEIAEEPIGLAAGQVAPPLPPTPEIYAPPAEPAAATASKYYPGQVVEAPPSTPYTAPSVQPTAQNTPAASPAPAQKPEDIVLHWDEPELSRGALLGRYAGALGVLLLLAGLCAFFLPGYYVVPLIIAQFVGAMLLPMMHIVPWPREEFDDAGLIAACILVGSFALGWGPLVALGIYAIYGFLIRQDVTPGALGCLVVATLARFVTEAAAKTATKESLAPLFVPAGSPGFQWPMLFISITALVTIVGWLFANVFHKLDE